MSIEERLARDIADVTRGVHVTGSDLRDARAAIDDRIESSRRHGHRRAGVIAAAAAVVALLLGLAAYLTVGDDPKAAPPANGSSPPPSLDASTAFLSGEVPTADNLRGIWRLDNGGVLLRFYGSDLVSWDRSGRLFESPGVHGRYEIDGKAITITVDGGPGGCGGQQLTLQAAVMANANLHIVHATTACRIQSAERWVMEQVLPTSRVMANLPFSTEKGWQPLTDKSLLRGTWLAEGGGHVLELGEDGTYHVAADKGEQVDYGEWSLRGSQLRLASWPDSVRCSVGDELVLGGVDFVDPGTTAFRGTVQKNTCKAPWTPKTWILVPYEESPAAQ